MRFSYLMIPAYPLADSMESIKKADELGFYGCYAADETWHKDMWLLFAAAADKTQTIRFGPSLSGVVLREPTLITQAVATLDELTDGRAECVISCGNFGLLAQYHIDWARTRPLSRTIEAHKVIRTLLDEGAITFDGEFFKYTGLFTFARPVQKRLPLLLGAMRGPRSFQAAGEISESTTPSATPARHTTTWWTMSGRVPRRPAGTGSPSTSVRGSCSRLARIPRRRRRPPAAWSGSTPRRCQPSSSSATA
jgi:5,10-methylenetetrahydromethanopterin reductase